ncbi:FliM/FliN family flagellar motor switch protein [Vibrio vulnificus]|nr:FliM/FliN family flagellar motor switch protein [Vibrio vulnificus]EIZ1408499.1 FliM/FliN family flagellar motor switch protein [Vibrio vulnificus]EIZ1412268.1 FliM/FliN family flagellar motor switch protein [Vibrio vulnificus]EJA3293444.1 FliM/FliN family flagellar motor switch protein [Vibrio vulnificus]EJA3297138.1 FliM/FliN family flagellar motor switch protein [Vibrio vulnificus]
MGNVLVEDIKLDEANAGSVLSKPTWKQDFINDLTVQVDIRLGGASITIEELFSWKKGSILKLDTKLNEPVEVLLDDKLIATGYLVACGNNYGIEIVDVNEQ